MKKTRFLVLALVVAVMLMGAGYAWWNDTITITNKVSTGVLDVDIVSQTVTPDTQYVKMSVVPDFVEDSDDGDAATIKFDDIYPGVGGKATLVFKNKSTMAVKLDRNMSFDLDPKDENFWWTNSDDKYVFIWYIPEIGDKILLAKNGNTLTYGGADIVIQPDAEATFEMTVKLPEGIDYDNQFQDMDQIGLTLKPNFIQHNR